MKSLLFTISLIVLLLMPVLASAQGSSITDQCCQLRANLKYDEVQYSSGDIMGPTTETPCTLGTINKPHAEWAMICTVATIYTVTNWIFFLMMALAVILIVIGGVVYMTAGGDPEKAGKGKSIIVFAIIGLAIALVARFIPPVVKFIMGVS